MVQKCLYLRCHRIRKNNFDEKCKDINTHRRILLPFPTSLFLKQVAIAIFRFSHPLMTSYRFELYIVSSFFIILMFLEEVASINFQPGSARNCQYYRPSVSNSLTFTQRVTAYSGQGREYSVGLRYMNTQFRRWEKSKTHMGGIARLQISVYLLPERPITNLFQGTF